MTLDEFTSNMAKEKLRTASCTECRHKTSVKNDIRQVYCDICEEYISNKTSERCIYYQCYKDKSDIVINGHKVKQYQTKEYMTINQWKKAGYKIKRNAQGVLMYSSEVSAKKYPDNLITYYSREEVEKI